MQEITIDFSLFFALIYIIIMVFFSFNGIFDSELVHFYLSDNVQMSIQYQYDPEILSNNRYPGPQKRIQDITE